MDLENKEVMQKGAGATNIKVARILVVNSSTFSRIPSSSTKNKKYAFLL